MQFFFILFQYHKGSNFLILVEYRLFNFWNDKCQCSCHFLRDVILIWCIKTEIRSTIVRDGVWGTIETAMLYILDGDIACVVAGNVYVKWPWILCQVGKWYCPPAKLLNTIVHNHKDFWHEKFLQPLKMEKLLTIVFQRFFLVILWPHIFQTLNFCRYILPLINTNIIAEYIKMLIILSIRK